MRTCGEIAPSVEPLPAQFTTFPLPSACSPARQDIGGHKQKKHLNASRCFFIFAYFLGVPAHVVLFVFIREIETPMLHGK